MVFKECYRILRDNTHAYFFFDIKQHREVLDILKDVGFDVDPIPLIWYRTGTGAQVNHPDQRWAVSYETAFFCRKGHRALIRQGQRNLFDTPAVPHQKKIHPTEKPTALLRALIETSTVVGEVVVDPFGGSGSTALAALQTGRNFITIEKREDYYLKILDRLTSYESGADSQPDAKSVVNTPKTTLPEVDEETLGRLQALMEGTDSE
jgi:tRNA G10  N-methylase Trm11